MDIPILFDDQATKDIAFWKRHNVLIAKRIDLLIKDIQRDPCPNSRAGLGKPEALKHDFSGSWSRRINQEHRIIYRYNADTQEVLIRRCKGHYS